MDELPTHIIFISEDGVMMVVATSVVLQSYVLSSMVNIIFDIEGKVEEPFRLPINAVQMTKMFTYYEDHENHEFEDSWSNISVFEDILDIFLTDEDYELLELTDNFSYDQLLDLFQTAMEFGCYQLEAAIGEFLRQMRDGSDEDELPPLELDLDSDEELTPEEEEELRQRYEWILHA